MSLGKKILLGGIGAIIILAALFSGKIIENVDNSEIVIVQSVMGKVSIYKTPGPVGQWFGTATHYKKRNQFWFSKKNDEGNAEDESIKIRFMEGGHAQISGSISWYMPNDDKDILKIHTDFGSQEAVEQQLIRQVVTKAVYNSGPLMSSKESAGEKRNDLLAFIEDQALEGVYKTEQKPIKIHDDLLNVDKTAIQVQIVQDTVHHCPAREEVSQCKNYNIPMKGLTFNDIAYDGAVEKQIQTQQQATMSVQTAIANSKKAEQDAITAELQGKAKAATAKWEIEVVKAKAVTQAESDLAVQLLQTKQAASYKQQQILEGEGDAGKQAAMRLANNNLDQKLAAYKEVQKYWADAFGKYQGNIVPQIVTGGSAVTTNGASDMMNAVGIKALKDLSLDLSNKK